MGAMDGTLKHRDQTGRVTLNHLEEPVKLAAKTTQLSGVGVETPLTTRALAEEYLRVAAGELEFPDSLLTPQFAAAVNAAGDASAPQSSLVFDKETKVRGNATVSYEQYSHSLPVWEAGVSVQIQTDQMQVIGAQSTVQDLDVQLPPENALFLEQRITPAILGKLLGAGNQQIVISHKEQYIYVYHAKDRLQVPFSAVTGQGELQIPFALPPVKAEIKEGAAYVATVLQFSLTTSIAPSGWLAMIEAVTGSVLMLRSLQGCAQVTIGDHAPTTDNMPTQDEPAVPPATNVANTTQDRKVVFFDIGDTLGRAIVSPAGQLSRIEIFASAFEVVEELFEKNCRVGIISDPGNFNPDVITSLLQDSGILEFLDRTLLIYGRKNSKEIFEQAANAAATPASRCVFVGESAAERAFAQTAGFSVQPSPDNVVQIIDPTAALAWVYLQDPLTKVGPNGPRPTASGTDLDIHRDLVSLRGLNTVAIGQNQPLEGQYVRLVNVSQPNPTLPSSPFPGDFRFSVNSNDFGAVNAYHNCDRLFRVLEDLGIDVPEYFGETEFPIRVDHRATIGNSANTVNAQAPGFRFPPRSDGFLFALAAANTSVGMAADWRVVLHEFGHAILWAHIGSPNFRFAHSPGDAIAAILNDVGNRAARATTFPWVDIGRSHQRPVSQFAWHGTAFQPFNQNGVDPAGYVAEQMLSSTLFRLYQAAGGDSPDRRVQKLAAAYVVFLILKSVGLMSTVNIPATPEAYADLLMQADTGTFLHEGTEVRIGALRKAIRWAFEMQGAFRSPAAGGAPTNRIGDPPAVDVFINDGRDGQYFFRNPGDSADIWNRTADDGGSVNQSPAVGQNNFAFVRVSNRGTSAANNVRVQAFQSAATHEGLWPNEWEPLDTPIFNAPVALAPGQQIVLGPFDWVPNSLNPTLMMAVSATGDQSGTSRFTTTEPIALHRLSAVDNNIAHRRFNTTS